MLKLETRRIAAMGLLACCLAISTVVGAASTTAHAADCPGLSDKNVSVMGTVIEHMTGAGMLKIETKECGKITVGIPAQTKDEMALYFEECELGAVAIADGDSILGILEAKELGCL